MKTVLEQSRTVTVQTDPEDNSEIAGLYSRSQDADAGRLQDCVTLSLYEPSEETQKLQETNRSESLLGC